jgi:hypothetical protein
MHFVNIFTGKLLFQWLAGRRNTTLDNSDVSFSMLFDSSVN